MASKIVQVNIGPLHSYVAAMDKNADMNNGEFGFLHLVPDEIVWSVEDPCLQIIAEKLDITIEEILEAYEKWKRSS